MKTHCRSQFASLGRSRVRFTLHFWMRQWTPLAIDYRRRDIHPLDAQHGQDLSHAVRTAEYKLGERVGGTSFSTNVTNGVTSKFLYEDYENPTRTPRVEQAFTILPSPSLSTSESSPLNSLHLRSVENPSPQPRLQLETCWFT